MAGRVEQTIKDWTIRRKILSGFGVVLALAAVLGWLAIRALDRMNVLSGQILRGELPPGAADQLFQDSRTAILGLLLATVAVGVVVALVLSRLIADPLTALGVMAEQVSKGDLTAEIRSQSRDEIGWLEHSMRQMVKNLRTMVTQITASSRAVATSAEEISASSTQLARGAETQSSSTEETS
ncbi:MAG TPA: methyl-accepting chemotaxis protein, partial [Gemmatimonadales bacterium]|nr:methyl-accepting chemotaxis protein [Gemmatimonadales bacterium]